MTKSQLCALLAFLLGLGLFASVARAQEEPPLPSGLAEEGRRPAAQEPALPPGLGAPKVEVPAEEPELPEGLVKEPTAPKKEKEARPAAARLFELSGFWEARIGVRTQSDPFEKDFSLGETRLQLELDKRLARSAFKLTSDFIFDPVLDRHSIDLEKGQGVLDLREASFALTPVSFMDVKVGRQVLTWGTGDLIFINDLFPKDWNSFFIGRDVEYLKAPSDAVKVSFYSGAANLDLVYTPRFDSDRFVDGRRISSFNTLLGRRAGRDAVVRAKLPNDWFDDDEIALRLFKNVRGYELAAYAYWGFWKSPGGTDPISGRATFPELAVYGASVRGAVAKGIGNIEIGFYDSRDDRGGRDPFVRNSEFRVLAGYEQEVAKDFTVGVQYNIEHMFDHDAYKRTPPPGIPQAEENHQLATLRLTKLMMRQNLRLSLFAFYSPSDDDAYLRPNIHYKISDRWSAEIGGNVFIGRKDHTFFGQFERNNNVYGALRCGF